MIFFLIFVIVGVFANDPYSYCWPPMPKAYPFPLGNYELGQVSALVRHGDRAPVHLMVYGEDHYSWECKNSETVSLADLDGSLQYTPQYRIFETVMSPALWHGSCGVGQLTERGIEQHYTLGKALRSIYVDKFHFFPDILSNLDQVYVRSTDLQRTRQSAMAQLAGLWDAKHRTSATLKIPIEIYPANVDTMQESEGACPRIDKLVAAMKTTDKWNEHLKNVSKTLIKMNSITGCNWDGVYKHSDVLHPLLCHNMSLPCRDGNCVTMEDLQIVHDGANFEMTYQYASDEIARLSVGTFLHELRDLLVGDQRSKMSPPYALYLGHDFTIAQIFQAFHLGIDIWPPYASHMIFELWKEVVGNKKAIRVLYNGEIMKIPGCTFASGTACTIDEFDKILERLKVLSYTECLN